MEQTMRVLRDVPPRPYKYMIIKNYVDTILMNFNYETFKTDDLKRGLEIISLALKKFSDMKSWQPHREEKPKKLSGLFNK